MLLCKEKQPDEKRVGTSPAKALLERTGNSVFWAVKQSAGKVIKDYEKNSVNTQSGVSCPENRTDMVKRFDTRYCYKTGVNAKEIEALIARGDKSRTLSGKKQNKMRGKRIYVLETTKTGNVVNDNDQKPHLKTNAVLNTPGDNSSNTVIENQKGVKKCPGKMQCASGVTQGSRVTRDNTEVVITSAVQSMTI